MNAFGWITRILVVVGALNWGLVAFGWNLVEAISSGLFATIVYSLVGLAGLWELIALFQKH